MAEGLFVLKDPAAVARTPAPSGIKQKGGSERSIGLRHPNNTGKEGAAGKSDAAPARSFGQRLDNAVRQGGKNSRGRATARTVQKGSRTKNEQSAQLKKSFGLWDEQVEPFHNKGTAAVEPLTCGWSDADIVELCASAARPEMLKLEYDMSCDIADPDPSLLGPIPADEAAVNYDEIFAQL